MKFFKIVPSFILLLTLSAQADKKESKNQTLEPYITLVSPQDLQSVRVNLEKFYSSDESNGKF